MMERLRKFLLIVTFLLNECSSSCGNSHFKETPHQSYQGRILPKQNHWALHSVHAADIGKESLRKEMTEASLYMSHSDEPIFDTKHTINVTALPGKTAILNCRVKNIGNNTVSWVRNRDIHLLTVGKISYTSDLRFKAVHSDGSEDWLLKIHYLQNRDEGWYHCQISATPPRSYKIHLSIVEPETIIEGSEEVYINTGSRLALACSVQHSPEPPAFIFWYHNDELVSYDRSKDGFQVKTENGPVSTSRLLIDYAETHHSGIYKCEPSNSIPKTVNVHVIAGEQPAAIQHDNNSNSGSLNRAKYLLSSVTCLQILTYMQINIDRL